MAAALLATGNGGPHELHACRVRRDLDAHMARAAVQRAAGVAVLRSAAGVARRVARLRHALVVHAITLAVHVEVIVAVEDGIHPVLGEQVVDRHRPPGAVFLEARRSIGVEPTPFEVRRTLDAAS